MSIVVVIPLFNGALFIRETLESVLAQEKMPEDVVVVDDGSTDGSPEIVSGFPTVRLLRNPRKSAAEARNHGLRASRSDHVAFLDHDDLWHPAHLRLLSEELRHHPEAPAAYSPSRALPHGDAPTFDLSGAPSVSADPWARFPYDALIRSPSEALVRRAAAESSGGFSSEHAGCADVHFWLKVGTLAPLRSIAAQTVLRRIHPGQQSADVRRGQMASIDKFLDAARAALSYRQELRPRDGARAGLERRLRALELGVAAARGLRDGDDDRVRAAAVSLEDALVATGDAPVAEVFGFLARRLKSGATPTEQRASRFELLRALYLAWPDSAPRSRRVLLEYASRKRLPIARLFRDLLRPASPHARYAVRLMARTLNPL